jgi:hypothetical protein
LERLVDLRRGRWTLWGRLVGGALTYEPVRKQEGGLQMRHGEVGGKLTSYGRACDQLFVGGEFLCEGDDEI